MSTWACFHPEMDLKATKMAFIANSFRKFSKCLVYSQITKPFVMSKYVTYAQVTADVPQHDEMNLGNE